MNSKIKREDDGIICYKGFDKELKCIDFQFQIGKTYTEPDAKLCECGFHACTNPIDVFKYYPPSSSRYCRVRLYDLTDEKSDDSKVVGKSIQIIKEIGVNDIISEFVAIAKKNANTGNCSAATNTGEGSAATNTGNCSAATNTGYRSAATNTGNCSAATNTGYRSAATNTGYWSAATNTGYRSAATNTGYWSAATNTGNCSAATNTGYWSAATNTGYRSAATNTGEGSAATNTGNCSAATNTGYRSAATVSGKNSIAIAAGRNSKASGEIGCAICVVERGEDGRIIAIKAAIVDGKNIKANVLYTLKNGEFLEIEE